MSATEQDVKKFLEKNLPGKVSTPGLGVGNAISDTYESHDDENLVVERYVKILDGERFAGEWARIKRIDLTDTELPYLVQPVDFESNWWLPKKWLFAPDDEGLDGDEWVCRDCGYTLAENCLLEGTQEVTQYVTFEIDETDGEGYPMAGWVEEVFEDEVNESSVDYIRCNSCGSTSNASFITRLGWLTEEYENVGQS